MSDKINKESTIYTLLAKLVIKQTEARKPDQIKLETKSNAKVENK
jgi:hypothetical protein